MNQQQAENAVLISAMLVGGMYGYRYFTEGESKSTGKESLAESGYLQRYIAFYHHNPVLPLGEWIPAYGVTYLGLSIAAAASPSIGGTAAILVAAGAFFGNVTAVLGELGQTTPGAKKPESRPLPKAQNHPPIMSGMYEPKIQTVSA